LSASFSLKDKRIEVRIDNPYSETYISPTLRFPFHFTNSSDDEIVLFNLNFLFYVIDNKGREYVVNFVYFNDPILELHARNQTSTEGFVTMNHLILKRIEEIRENRDLRYKFFGNFAGIHYPQTGAKQEINKTSKESISGRISKSDWVENHLPLFQYKDVHLLEIPRIDHAEFKQISEYLNSAWRQKAMGQYDKVLTDCRKTIEELGSIVKKKGYLTKNEKGEDLPDWKKYFSNEEIGELFGAVNQKIYGFTWPGAHSGKSINLEDADYALMITHAIANRVIKKWD